MKNTIESLKKHFGRDFDALEVAAGTGRNLFEFQLAFPHAKIDVMDIKKEFVDTMRTKYSSIVRNFYTGNALNINSLIEDKEYHCIIVQGLVQYFDNADFRKFLLNTKKLLAPGGKIFLKEQYSSDQPTYYEPEHFDWMRSVNCFVSAFKDAKLNATVINKHSWGDYNENLTWILTPSNLPEFKDETHSKIELTEVHSEPCAGWTRTVKPQ